LFPFPLGKRLLPTIQFPFPLGKRLHPTIRFPFPLGKGLLPTIRFPFPLGKGLGVRFLTLVRDPKTISDGTNPPVVADRTQYHHRWYEQVQC
jgi:hypothetical protein